MTGNEIVQKLRELMPELKNHYGVERIGLFGSFARNDVTEKSDIDILVKLEDPSFLKLARLLNFLEDTFHKKVDITTQHKYLSPRFVKIIERDLIYA
jgi:predicted nucleotidyltransferase